MPPCAHGGARALRRLLVHSRAQSEGKTNFTSKGRYSQANIFVSNLGFETAQVALGSPVRIRPFTDLRDAEIA